MSDDPEPRAQREPGKRDQSEWVTGDEPMTGPQRSYHLSTLAQGGRGGGARAADQGGGLELIEELQQRPRAGPMISADDVGCPVGPPWSGGHHPDDRTSGYQLRRTGQVGGEELSVGRPPSGRRS